MGQKNTPSHHNAKTIKSQPIEEAGGISPRLVIGAIGGSGLLVAIAAAVLLLMPGGSSPFTTLNASNPQLSHPDGLTITLTEDATLQVAVDTISPTTFEAGGADSGSLAGAHDVLPSHLLLKSPVYTIQTEGSAPVSVAITVPPQAEPFTTLDIYGWNPVTQQWQFVPNRVDRMTRVARFSELPSAVALFQTRRQNPLMGTVLEEDHQLDASTGSALNLVMPVGLVADSSGAISGTPGGGWQPGAGYAVAPVVRAATPESIQTMLHNEALWSTHIEALQQVVTSSGYNGLTIDYGMLTGVERATFTRYFTQLGDAFDQINRVLVVILPPAQQQDAGWFTGAYDWRAVGQAADVVVLHLGDNPAGYTPSGQSSAMLEWAVGEISRRKLLAATSTYSYDASTNALISFDEAVHALGSVQVLTPPDSGEIYSTDSSLSFNVAADSSVTADQSTRTVKFTTSDGRSLQIVTASAIRHRLELISSYNVGGITLTRWGAPENDELLTQAVTEFKTQAESTLPDGLPLIWTATGPDGSQTAETVGVGTPWNWRANGGGGYEVAAVVGNSRAIELGSAEVVIAGSPQTPGSTEIANNVTQPPVTQPPATSPPTTPPPATQATAPPTTPPPTAQPTNPPPANPGSGFALGGQVPGFITHGSQMKSSGMSWVKYQIKWSPGMDPAVAANNVSEAKGQGFRALLSITGPLYPQSIDFDGYVNFLRGVAGYGPDAIEVWNEMNLDREWPAGQLNPSSYVNDMLAPAYRAIKDVSPNTMVIIGALAPTGFDNGTNAWSDQRYVQGMASAGAARYADCIGAHHNSGTTSPSVRSGRSEGDHYSWYFLPTLEVYYYGIGQALPVCVTEFGYLSADGFNSSLPSNFAWASTNSVQEHAAWLGEGISLSRQAGYVRMVIVFNVGFTTWTSDDPQAGYSIIRPDGSCPACSTLASAMQ